MTKAQAAESITALMSGYSAMTDAQKAGAIEAAKALADLIDEAPTTPETITVREYIEGEEERPVFLHTHCGALQVTGVHFFSDGPWLVTGRGLTQSSWCVAYSDRLYFDKAEAERSAS